MGAGADGKWQLLAQLADSGKWQEVEDEQQRATYIFYSQKELAKCPEAVSVFILPPSFGVLEKRLRRRATDSEEAVQKRLAAARGEILQAADYDYMVVNDALEDCVSDLEAVLQGEKCRSARAGNLIEEVLKNE